jgi:ABC-type antimicrobial peptide transport system permease subunit
MSVTVADPDALDLRPPLMDRVLRFCRKQPLGTFGLVLVLIIAVTGIFAEFLAPYNPTANDFGAMQNKLKKSGMCWVN